MTHALISTLRREAHWQLTDADARAYAQAVKNVARHYSIGVTQKGLDFYALGMCIVNVEGARLVASYRAKRARRAGADRPSPTHGATVYPFPGNSPPPPPDSAAADPQPIDGGTVEGFTADGIDGPIGGKA